MKTAYLDISGINKLRQKHNKLESKVVEYGFVTSDIHSPSRLPVGTLATMLEYGTRTTSGKKWHIPPRPALRQSVETMKAKPSYFEGIIGRHFADYLYGKTSSPNAIFKVSGEELTSHYQDTMRDWLSIGSQYQSNAKETIEVKGFNMPYTFTGELISSAQHQIRSR